MTSEPAARPRPEYGEYATPEEQRARIQQPDVTAALSSGEAVAPAPVPQPRATRHAKPLTTPAGPGTISRRSAVNRIITIGLLAYGLISVISTMVSLSDFGAYVTRSLSLLGMDATLSNPDAARGWVFAAMVVLGVGWLLTAVVTVRVMRAGRVSWWIPVVAGPFFTLIAGVLIAVPLMSDPAITNAINTMAG